MGRPKLNKKDFKKVKTIRLSDNEMKILKNRGLTPQKILNSYVSCPELVTPLEVFDFIKSDCHHEIASYMASIVNQVILGEMSVSELSDLFKDFNCEDEGDFYE